MKEKFAVSVIVTLILASFCLAEAQQTAKANRIGFIFILGRSWRYLRPGSTHSSKDCAISVTWKAKTS